MRRLLRVLVAALLVTVAGVAATGSPAAAALPDAHGFVLWNGAATVPSGTWPAATSVAAGPAGVYTIKFPGQAAKGGVVHVTAVNSGPRFCQAVKWGPSGLDEIAVVLCSQPGGALVPTAFSAVFEASSGPSGPINGEFGYVDFDDSTGTMVDQYNSVGALNGVTPLGGGLYEVKLPGLSTAGAIDGGLQVTAVNGTPARCKVRNWTSGPGGQVAYVACFTSTGAPFKTRFTLTYQYNQSLWGAGWPPKYFGYLWLRPPVGPPTTNFNSQLGFGANTLLGVGTGLSLVTFPRLAVLPDNIQVTAAGGTSAFCNLLAPWAHTPTDIIVRDVACYDSGGARVDTGFLISANSAN
ncbi:hypothetical protein Daura_27375 [Dactylosporangium aurantiacum]|uniref:Secreted protein n=1 Tax=Dactylosporangium aurantiacum TaxID=35754 RepID=A0A9Q9I6I4_9ACTN|nr:hypothetical protein [Dactylosporangium aurantiacum]MDG6106411.1 hypothetical protein [Dactylosporangium aurantiacum]UWZ50549.1 hypothetical protein Daura_27375 [Dactylosporangium aurantiacum]